MAGTFLTVRVTGCRTWNVLVPVVLLFGLSVTVRAQISSATPPYPMPNGSAAQRAHANPNLKVGGGKRVGLAGSSVSAATPLAYNVSGMWTDSWGLGYTFTFAQNASGNVSGTANYDTECSVPWPISGFVSGSLFTFTGTNPTGGGDGCAATDAYVLTFSSDGDSATGTFTETTSGGTIYGPTPVTLYRNGGTPTIQISLTPAPPSDEYLITSTPTMPVIQATAAVINVTPDPTPTTTFTWTATLTIDENGGTGATVDYSDDIVQNTTTTGSATYTLTFTDPSFFEGGTLTLTATAMVNGQTLTASTPSDLVIDGTNPQRSTIQSAIITQVPSHSFYGLQNGNVDDVVQRIACRESGQIQFDAAANGGQGAPLVASDNGIGIMQITQSSPDLFVTKPEVVFDWQTNTTLGVTTYQTKVKSALAYPASLRNDNDITDPDSYQYYVTHTINPARVVAGLMPITILPAPNFTTAGNLGSNPPNQLLEDGVRGYNGFAGTPVFDTNVLHEFIPNATFLMTVPNAQLSTLSTNPNVWARVCSVPGAGLLYGPVNSSNCSTARGTSGDPVYVNNVAANPPLCPSGSRSN